jgi:hypothetical protein
MATLRVIDCSFRPQRHARTLRAMTFLRRINGRPAEEFWQAFEARQKSLDEWFLRVGSLTDEEKLKQVAIKLKELNPGFDGQVFPKYTDGRLTVLQFFVDGVTDIEPVRVLNHLERLTIRGTGQGLGRLFDLDPLGDLSIQFLECGFSEVADLTSLQGTTLRVLLCRGTRVRDLTPVRELPLFYLDISNTPVSDLSPLVGMGVSNLHIRGVSIEDYSPLTKLPVRVLGADLDPVRDEALLKSLPRLELLNDRPISESWKQ